VSSCRLRATSATSAGLHERCSRDCSREPGSVVTQQAKLCDVRDGGSVSLSGKGPSSRLLHLEDALREAMENVDESTRLVAEELLHDVLAAIAAARETAERRDGVQPADPPPDAPTNAPTEADERNRKR